MLERGCHEFPCGTAFLPAPNLLFAEIGSHTSYDARTGAKVLAGPHFDGSFEFVEHTADIAVRLRGGTPAALFEAAAAALTEAVTERGTVMPALPRTVRLVAPDLDRLLVDWLEEILFLFETERFLVRESRVEITHDITKDTKDTKEGNLAGNSQPVDHCDLTLRDLRVLRGLCGDYVIRGSLLGETRDPARHPLKVLIKAVTYHGLHIAETADGCEAMVVFDV